MITKGTKKGRPRRDLTHRIVETARSLFFARGIEPVTILEIASSLGTSKSAIYRHFPSKEAIVRAVVERIDSDLNEQVGAIVQGPGEFPEKLGKLVRFTARMLEQSGSAFLIDLQSHYRDAWNWYQSGRRERVERLYGQLLRQGQEESVLRRDISLPLLIEVYLALSGIAVNDVALPIAEKTGEDLYQVITSVFFDGTRHNSRQPRTAIQSRSEDSALKEEA